MYTINTQRMSASSRKISVRNFRTATCCFISAALILATYIAITFLFRASFRNNCQRCPLENFTRSDDDISLASPVVRMFRCMFGSDFLPPETVGLVIQTADIIKRQNKGRPLLIAFVNNAFVPFTLNWLCNTKHMGIHDDILLIATDNVARITLLQHWPNIRVISLNLEVHKSAQTYGEAGYTKILIVRSTVLSALVSSGIDIVHFETDALWLQNPLPVLSSLRNYDVIAQTCYERPYHFPLGFLYLNNTLSARTIIHDMLERFADIETKIRDVNQNQEVSEAEMDQPILSDLIMRYPGIRTMHMDYNLYTDGMWYNSSEIRRNAPRPLMIQNNWIKSIDSKIDRIKQWKHWFLNGSFQCEENLVRNIVYDYPH